MKFYYTLDGLLKDVKYLKDETIIICKDFEKTITSIGMPEYKNLKRRLKENNVKIMVEPTTSQKYDLYKFKKILEYYNKEEKNEKSKTL